MGKRKSMMTAEKYDDAYKRKTIKPWSDLTYDVLSLVMMKLEVVDFLAFSKVCKSWRSLALTNRNKFIVSKPPMFICISKNANKKECCYLKDFEGRNLKIIVPHLAGRECIGVSCGYLIFFGEKTFDFWLVNPITRHELHSPHFPSAWFFRSLDNVRAILVFSPSMSRWVFVVLAIGRFSDELWFSIEGEREWTKVSTGHFGHFGMCDLIAFKGKIYALVHPVNGSDEVRMCELKLYPEPKLVLLSFPMPYFLAPRYVSCGENLYLIDWVSLLPKRIHELDFGEMKVVSRENAGEKYVFFCNDFNYWRTFIVREVWADIHSQYGRYALNGIKGLDGFFTADMWYFFDDCLNANLLHE